MVTAKATSTVETKDDGIPNIDALLVTTKPIMIPPFGCQ